MERQRGESKVSRDYTYRRELRPAELLPAVGAGVAVGLVAFYVARLFLQRTPLVPGPLEPADRLEPRRRTGTRQGDDQPRHRRDRGAATRV
ncbi:MAG: hypothetical protein HOQ09_01220 [Gemmatimonadaceae bacterium]|nr:hypothetical protein [Gemmatimonadaceae bacterium]